MYTIERLTIKKWALSNICRSARIKKLTLKPSNNKATSRKFMQNWVCPQTFVLLRLETSLKQCWQQRYFTALNAETGGRYARNLILEKCCQTCERAYLLFVSWLLANSWQKILTLIKDTKCRKITKHHQEKHHIIIFDISRCRFIETPNNAYFLSLLFTFIIGWKSKTIFL